MEDREKERKQMIDCAYKHIKRFETDKTVEEMNQVV